MVDPSVAEHLIPEVLIGDDSEDFEEANGENNAEINTEQQSDAENKAEQLKDTESQAEDEYQGELETQVVLLSKIEIANRSFCVGISRTYPAHVL
jgi:hypothetical protein